MNLKIIIILIIIELLYSCQSVDTKSEKDYNSIKNNCKILRKAAEKDLKDNKLSESLRLLTLVIFLDENDPIAHRLKGECFSLLKQYDLSNKEYICSLFLGINEKDYVYFLLAKNKLMKNNDYIDAKILLDKAIRINKNVGRYYYSRAYCNQFFNIDSTFVDINKAALLGDSMAIEFLGNDDNINKLCKKNENYIFCKKLNSQKYKNFKVQKTK